MSNVLTIVGKELRSYFVSPVAYVVLTGFLLLGGWFFFNLLSRFNLMLSLYTQMQQGRGGQSTQPERMGDCPADEQPVDYSGHFGANDYYAGVC